MIQFNAQKRPFLLHVGEADVGPEDTDREELPKDRAPTTQVLVYRARPLIERSKRIQTLPKCFRMLRISRGDFPHASIRCTHNDNPCNARATGKKYKCRQKVTFAKYSISSLSVGSSRPRVDTGAVAD